MSSDNVLVVAHDFTLNNFTNSTGTIIDKSWDHLKWLQVTRGGKNAAAAYAPHETRLIDFETLVVEAKRQDLDLIVELRIAGDKTELVVSQFLDIVRRHNLEKRVVMQTFFPNIIWKVKRAAPEIFTMQLFLPSPLSSFCRLKVHDSYIGWQISCGYLARVVDFLADMLILPISSAAGADSIGAAFPLLDSATIHRYRDAGFTVVAWTVNTAEEKAQVKEAGIRVLMSDCPFEFCPSVLRMT